MNQFKLLIVGNKAVEDCSLVNWESYNIVETFTAIDGENGLSLAIKENPQLIIFDIHLPVMDGLTMIEKLKESNTYRHLPRLLIYSSLDDSINIQRIIECGVDFYLAYPQDKEKITEKIKIMEDRYNKEIDIFEAKFILDNVKEEVDRKYIKVLVEKEYTDIKILKEVIDSQGLPFIEDGYVIVGVLNADNRENPEEIYQLCRILNETISKANIPGRSAAYYSRSVTIVSNVDIENIKMIIELAFEVISRMTEKTFSVVISKNFTDLDQIKSVYENAKRIANNNFYSFKNNIKVVSDRVIKSKVLVGALNIIHQEYMNDLSVKYVAEKLNVSESNIMHSFKREIGDTFKQTLLLVRLNEAEKMLLSGKYQISEVAYKSGFNGPKYFSTIFKKRFGCTPSEYIKEK